MTKAFVRSDDVHSKLHNTLVLIKEMPFWTYHLAGMSILCIPLFNVKTDVSKDFWETFVAMEHKGADFVAGAGPTFSIDANHEAVDLSVPDFGYVNVYDYSHGASKPTYLGPVWVSRRPARASVYGINNSVVVETRCTDTPGLTSWGRTNLYSWGDALLNRFPTILEAREILRNTEAEAVAFDKHFCLVRQHVESDLLLVFYNNVKVAIIGKKLRVLPMWRKPWFEKMLAKHTWMLR